MAKTDKPKTVRLTYGEDGPVVEVSEEKAARLLAGTGYAKAPARRSKSTS